MQHIAILNPCRAKVEDIVKGDKTIESRWYVHKTAPWNKVKKGETVYFKKTSGPVSLKCIVDKVVQYEKPSLDVVRKEIGPITGVGLINLKGSVEKWISGKNYIILIYLKNIKEITPFEINKEGFGNAAAWLCFEDILSIKK